ncbi:MAG: tetratricopeptide repeat protein [Candidatus Contendobacter sp.]|jgi:Flp pilus assembly protein TadD|nr:tetratricopeptide repeat protein [Gammaproteobacteria bacterium]MCC8993655.1 tetratricopeptide repeat protein [Candidatus Contendobacter sp.]
MFRIALIVAGLAMLPGCATLNGLSNSPMVDAGRSSSDQPSLTTTDSGPAKPADPAFIEERAQQAYETGRWDVAEGYYLQLTRLKPKDASAWFQLGNLYAEQGRLDSAERAYREALRRRDDARVLHNLGLIQVKLGIGALREAQTRLPPTDAARRETRELLRTLLETALP